MRWILFLFLCFTYINCKVTIPSIIGTILRPLLDGRIVGGKDVNITRVPYQVSVQQSGIHLCGGTIVASDIIVTAAHCLYGQRPGRFSIRAGSSFAILGGDVYAVRDFIKYPGFTMENYNNDVAVLLLSNQLVMSDTVAPIQMKESTEEITDGDNMLVTGWGKTVQGGRVPHGIMLQKVTVQKVNDSECNDAYKSITPTMLCAGHRDGGKDSCQLMGGSTTYPYDNVLGSTSTTQVSGDSGGPLVHDKKLAGIVSFGYGCAQPEYPGVYAKVSALRNWIDTTIEQIRLDNAESAAQ